MIQYWQGNKKDEGANGRKEDWPVQEHRIGAALLEIYPDCKTKEKPKKAGYL